MRKFSVLNNIKQLSLSLAFFATSYSVVSLTQVSEVNAQKRTNSGVVLNRGKARNFGARVGNGVRRSGVAVGTRRNSSTQNFSRLKLRQKQVFDRNVFVQRQNELRFQKSLDRRVRPNGRPLLSQNDSGFLTEEIVGLDSNGNVSSCPSKFNCGFRIYSNGTGPRIIRPGVDAGGDLPQFDGVSGAKVITLD